MNHSAVGTAALTAASMMLAAVPAAANPFAELTRDAYAGLNLGTTSSDASATRLANALTTATTVNSVFVDESGTAWRLFVGRPLYGNLAAEIGFVDAADIRVTVDADANDAAAYLTQLARETPVAPGGMTFDLVGQWSFAELGGSSERAFLFGRLGVMAWRTKVSYSTGTSVYRYEDDGVDLHFGLGGGVQITDQFSARLEWERFNATTRVDSLSVGFVYKF